MAGLDLLVVQDSITDKVKLLLPNTMVLEDSIPDDRDLPRDQYGELTSFVVVRHGPLRSSRYGKAFMGPRYDDYYSTCDVICIAYIGRNARAMSNVTTDGLIAFQPEGGEKMILEPDTVSFTVASNEARPTQYGNSTRFRFGINGEDVGAHVTP